MDLRDAPDRLGNDGNGSEEEGGSLGRWMIVEHHCDQADGEHQAGGYPPSQLVPHGVERDFLAEPLALNIAAIKIVRENRQKRAEKQLKHRSVPGSGPTEPF